MKDFVIEMLKKAKPWGTGFVITAICWLISFFMNGENRITLLWMSISSMLGVILIAHFILILFPCLSTLIRKITVRIVRKSLQMDKTDFEKNKDYYRDILDNNTPLVLGYLDNLELDKRDLIAEILYFIKKDIIKIEEGRLKQNGNWINLKLKDSEMEILDNIILGKLVMYKDVLLELRDTISREAERLELLQKKYIKRKPRKRINDAIMIKVIGALVKLMFALFVIGVFIKEVMIIFSLIMLGVLVLVYVVFPSYDEYRRNLGQLYKRTAKGRELNKKLEGLKNYLKDYSLMDERESKEIELWDDYLIWSVMFGQNKKIIEEYEKYIEII